MQQLLSDSRSVARGATLRHDTAAAASLSGDTGVPTLTQTAVKAFARQIVTRRDGLDANIARESMTQTWARSCAALSMCMAYSISY